MGRRTFLRTMAVGVLAVPLAAEAQPAGKVYRIGVISSGINPRSSSFFRVFERGLRDFGWVEGTNLAIDYRIPRGQSDFAALAADLARENVDVILAGGPEASLKAARRATTTIPIVIVALNYDPAEKGCVASLAHPGGNVTGVFSRALEIGAKALLARECTLTSPTVARQTTSIGFCAARRLPTFRSRNYLGSDWFSISRRLTLLA